MKRMAREGLLVALGMILIVSWGIAADDTQKAAEARKKLQQKLSVDFESQPLFEVVTEIKEHVKGLGIRLDTAGGVSQNIRIKYKADNKSLADILDGMFAKNGLGYIVISKDGDAYDGTVFIKQGKERGFPLGDEPVKTADKKEKADPAKSNTKTAPKPTPKTEPVVEGPEQEAARRFRLAKSLADDGVKARAKERLEEIIKKYPETKAAEDARELLKKLNM